MRIRSIKLTNFRKFVGSVQVDGISDGVNVLVGQNELGKSTLLEAINGVIFERAKSQTETVRSFRHFVNGTVPEVEMAFDLAGTRWTIWKRFSGQTGKALLTGSNSRRFEDEAAETELQRMLEFTGRRGGGEPGIWGTLWVRQRESFGDAPLDDFGRRTLLGCIEAQVGVVTGGERGRKIPESVEKALSELVSARGARGKFKEAKDKLEELVPQLAALEGKRKDIFTYMESLASRRRDLRLREAGWDDAENQRQLEDARNARTSAVTKAAEIEAARAKSSQADERLTRAENAVSDRARLASDVAGEVVQVTVLEAEAKRAEADRDSAKLRVDGIKNRLTGLREEERLNGEQGRRLERIRTATGWKAEIEKYEAAIRKSEELEAEALRLTESVGEISATREAVARIEAATTALASASAALKAVATIISVSLEQQAIGRVKLDGLPLDTSKSSVSAVNKTVVSFEGSGEVIIEPQLADRDEVSGRFRDAEYELRAALAASAVESLADARLQLAKRNELERQVAEARREISHIAPADPSSKLVAGLDSRRSRIHELRGRLQGELLALTLSELPSVDEIAAGIAENHASAERLAADILAAEAELEGPSGTLAEAEESFQTIGRKLSTNAGALDTKRASLAVSRAKASDEDLAARVTELGRNAESLKDALQALEEGQGETVEAIDARIKRLEAAAKNHRDAVVSLNTEITRLTTQLEANEGTGVEEAIEAASAEQSRLESAVKAYEEEVEVLKLLRDVLREAEREAKSRYLAPVVSRVEPYLRMLLPGAQLVLDEDLSINAIKRGGEEEAFANLSEGTQEQLAVLTRLAFAELLLAQGRPATVILDDALAFSDDERIEKMFDILMRAGEAVQILVLTCRQRLFARLGAAELRIDSAE